MASFCYLNVYSTSWQSLARCSGKRTNTRLPGNTQDQNTGINSITFLRRSAIFRMCIPFTLCWTDHRSKLSMRIQASKRTRGPSTVNKLDVNRLKDPTVIFNFNKAMDVALDRMNCVKPRRGCQPEMGTFKRHGVCHCCKHLGL